GEKYAPAVLRAVPENLPQVGISRLFGCRQPRLKTLFPRLKFDEARAQRRIIRGRVILANEDHGGKSEDRSSVRSIPRNGPVRGFSRQSPRVARAAHAQRPMSVSGLGRVKTPGLEN